MIRRSLAALGFLAVAAAPLAAQGYNAAGADKKAPSAAPLPAGWTGRTDRENVKLSEAKFVTMGTGYHVTSGPSAIYWNPAHAVKGPFTLTASLTQTKAPAHPEAFGVFFMGSKLNAPDQSYAYLLVRGDGKFLVNHRAGKEIHKLIEWTENAAIKKADANGKSTNVITVDATKSDSLRMLVNGTQVAALPMSDLGGPSGQVGLRVNHNLDVHVGEFTVTPKK